MPGTVFLGGSGEEASLVRVVIGEGGERRASKVRGGEDPLLVAQTLTRQLAGLSHDVRGGMTSIMAAMDALDDIEDPGEQADMKDAMQKQLAQMAEILREQCMLVFPLWSEIAEVDVRDALEEVIGTFKGAFQRSRIHLGWSFAEGALTLSGDAGHLQVAVANLLSNAREASSKGGAVRIEAREQTHLGRSWVVIDTLDTGKGLGAEQLDRLGDLGAFATHNKMAAGLFVAAHAVARLGGALMLQPRPGRGTLARLVVPR